MHACDDPSFSLIKLGARFAGRAEESNPHRVRHIKGVCVFSDNRQRYQLQRRRSTHRVYRSVKVTIWILHRTI